MCQFGSESKILEELDVPQNEAIRGYRSWYITNPFNDKEKFLKSLNQDFLWPKKKICLGYPDRYNSEGIYNYNNYNNYYNYYNYNNCNYYNNYNYNNYNNYNYNNYNYYNYNYNNYNYYNYYVCGCSNLFGKVFKYKEGYRSSHAIPTQLVIFSDKRWFEDAKTVKFAEHFNKIIEDLAKEYDCVTIGYDDWIKQDA